MLAEFRAEPDLRGQRINLSWTWTGPGDRPRLCLARRRRAYPLRAEVCLSRSEDGSTKPEAGLCVFDLAELFREPYIPWARIERTRYLVPNSVAEGGLLQAEVTCHFIPPGRAEPARVVIAYYDPPDADSGRVTPVFRVKPVEEVTRLKRTVTSAPPWERVETLKIFASPGGAPEVLAGRVVVSTSHEDGVTPNRFEWIAPGESAVSADFDLAEVEETTANSVTATAETFQTEVCVVREGVKLRTVTFDEALDPDTGDWKRHMRVADMGLEPEAVYYYALFAPDGTVPDAFPGEHTWRASAMATGRYSLGERLYQLLPAILKQYDEPAPGQNGDGPLRRYLQVCGAALDQVRSQAEGLRGRHDLLAVDAARLPHLARWIGWDLDRTLDELAQRNEILFAPELYRTVGTVPNLQALVNQVTGWGCRIKEFVHNVARSNQPERLNLWACQQDGTGQWTTPEAPLSLDFAYEGRPAAVQDGNGTHWLFYHTLRGNRWEIWYKTRVTFGIDKKAFAEDLKEGIISPALRQAFRDQGFPLGQDAVLEGAISPWRITDGSSEERYSIRQDGDELTVYCPWAPSQLLTDGVYLDRHPAAAIHDGGLWVFWDAYDRQQGTWSIKYRIRDVAGAWSAIQTLTDPGAADEVERRQPLVAVDGAGGLWLFWLERTGPGWQLKYNRHEGDAWDGGTLADFLASAEEFPLDDGGKGVQNDVFVLAGPEPRLWVFWALRVPVPGDEATHPKATSWQISYRSRSLDRTADGWSEAQSLPRRPAGYDCREPAAIWNDAEGAVEVYCSSNREGSWSLWRSALDGWEGAERITGNPYSERDPLPIVLPGGTLLVYRSNASLTHRGGAGGVTEVLDSRYAGCTTLDIRNLAKVALKGQYEDFQTYTYDTGVEGKRTNLDWYARDTVGLYLTPDTDDEQLIIHNQDLIERVLQRFLPVQVRVVFVIALGFQELVYTYDFEVPEDEHRLIGERAVDTTIPETLFAPGDSHPKDVVPGWILMRAWGVGDEDPELEHFRVTVSFPESEEPEDMPEKPPPDTRFRTWHVGLEMEDEPWT